MGNRPELAGFAAYGLLEKLLQAPAGEACRGILFQEEARAERLCNLIRLVYLVAWLVASAVYASENDSDFTRINFGIGGVWLIATVALHVWLSVRHYRPLVKYASTTADMFASTALLLAYTEAAGPVFAFKMPIVLNYFCCLGLASLRFHLGLAAYAAGAASILYLLSWSALDTWPGMAYGDSFGHAYAGVLHPDFLADYAIYMVLFGFLTVVASFNVRRLVTLRVAEGERAAREEERALMAAGLAHEVRNPLAGICAAAQLWNEQSVGGNRYATLIMSDASRLNGVVEGFLKFARPFTIRPEQIDMVTFLHDFCSEQNRLYPKAPLEVGFGTARSTREPIWVRTDSAALRQILLNLVQNARRFQISSRPVRVHLDAQAGTPVVCVEDDGPGVPELLRASLFEPFCTRSTHGTGLGLALSRKMARALGGDLTHEPLSPGARFVLTLGTCQSGIL